MDFDRFLRHACPPLCLDWRKYRRRAARHRIIRRMGELNIYDYPSYLGLLRTDPNEADKLADLMRITVSRFFRDVPCWSDLALKALPAVLAGKSDDNTLRVWSAGCCGGEEPYTMVLVWLEYLLPLFPGFTIDVLATDIDDSSLCRACKGVYEKNSLREAPPEIRGKWFREDDSLRMIDERVKLLVHFEKSNLMEDPPPSGMDLVFCRYLVFTYYRGERLWEAARRLHGALRPGGVLMIGSREKLNERTEILFEKWPDTGCLFRRRKD